MNRKVFVLVFAAVVSILATGAVFGPGGGGPLSVSTNGTSIGVAAGGLNFTTGATGYLSGTTVNIGLVGGGAGGSATNPASLLANGIIDTNAFANLSVTEFSQGHSYQPLPHMGLDIWYSNLGTNRYTETGITNELRSMFDRGLVREGYNWFQVTDGWSTNRSGGSLRPNSQIPNLTNLIQYAHDLGIKVALYTEPSTGTCNGGAGTPVDRIEQDAQDFFNAGVDAVRVDFCNIGSFTFDEKMYILRRWRAALDSVASTTRQMQLWSSGWAINYSNVVAGINWDEVSSVCNWLQVVLDHSIVSTDPWQSGLRRFHDTLQVAPHLGPGHWLRPDIQNVGDTASSSNRTKSLQALFAMIPSVREISISSLLNSTALRQVTNQSLIALNWDPLTRPGSLVVSNASFWIAKRELYGGDCAVALINPSNTVDAVITAGWTNLGINGKYFIYDVIDEAWLSNAVSHITATVVSNSAKVFWLRPVPKPVPGPLVVNSFTDAPHISFVVTNPLNNSSIRMGSVFGGNWNAIQFHNSPSWDYQAAAIGGGSNQTWINVQDGANGTITFRTNGTHHTTIESDGGWVMKNSLTVSNAVTSGNVTVKTNLSAATIVVTNTIEIPPRAGLSSIYASNGPVQYYTLGSHTNLPFVPLPGSQSSNTITAVAFTQNGTGGFYPTNNGRVIVINTNANATTWVYYDAIIGGTTNVDVAIPNSMSPPSDGQVLTYDGPSGMWTNEAQAVGGVSTNGSGAGKALVSNDTGTGYQWDYLGPMATNAVYVGNDSTNDIVIYGDSWATTIGGGNSTNVLGWLTNSYLGWMGWRIATNTAVGGRKLADMGGTTYTNEVQPWSPRVSGRPRGSLVIIAGGNDFAQASNAVQVLSILSNIVALARLDGFTEITVFCPPTGMTLTGLMEIELNYFSALLKAQKWWDFIIDTPCVAPGPGYAEYWHTDGVHPTDYMVRRIAEVIALAWQRGRRNASPVPCFETYRQSVISGSYTTRLIPRTLLLQGSGASAGLVMQTISGTTPTDMGYIYAVDNTMQFGFFESTGNPVAEDNKLAFTANNVRFDDDVTSFYSLTFSNTITGSNIVTTGTGTNLLTRTKFTDGVQRDGGGLKHARVTTGEVGIGSTVLVTVTWDTAFADANYTVQAQVQDSTTTSLSLSVVHVESVAAGSVTVRVINNSTTTALTGTLHALAIHD